jgi:hypothetical protein
VAVAARLLGRTAATAGTRTGTRERAQWTRVANSRSRRDERQGRCANMVRDGLAPPPRATCAALSQGRPLRCSQSRSIVHVYVDVSTPALSRTLPCTQHRDLCCLSAAACMRGSACRGALRLPSSRGPEATTKCLFCSHTFPIEPSFPALQSGQRKKRLPTATATAVALDVSSRQPCWRLTTGAAHGVQLPFVPTV